mgnify:CR=1 FL=1
MTTVAFSILIANTAKVNLTHPTSLQPLYGLLDVSVVYHSEVTQLFEGIYLFLRGRFLNYKSVHPYRTQEVTMHVEPRTLVGIDGRLMPKTPAGPFKVTVEKEVINFLIPA